MNYHESYLQYFHEGLVAVEFADSGGESLDSSDWLSVAADFLAGTKTRGGRIFFAGNGASAAFASHMMLDWSKNGGVSAVSLNDPVQLTALGNDLGYDEVFAAPLKWHGREGDLLVTISSSGNSPNIIRAIEVAREQGMRVITFSGLKPDNRSRKMGDLNIFVPAKTYGMVECAHQVLLHMWLDHSMGVCEWDRDDYQNMRVDEFSL